MLLVVCPNLAIDRILEVNNFQASRVQRSRSVLLQPGGKGSNVARVFRQLGGEVALIGFVGLQDRSSIVPPLEAMNIHVDAVTAYEGHGRTCTIVCDSQRGTHPTVINEESPPVDQSSLKKMVSAIDRWLPRVDAVLTTGSLARGLPGYLYAEILDRARSAGKLTAIDAAGDALCCGLLARPVFMKPNTEEFRGFVNRTIVSPIAAHTALTFGNAGAAVIHDGECLYARPPRIYSTNPIGAGDAFTAAYLKSLMAGESAAGCLRWSMAASASDASTLRPGMIDASQVALLARKVELRFQR